MDRFNTEPALIHDWMKGKAHLFVIVFAYNSGMDPAYGHREAHGLAGPDLKAAQQAAENLLSRPWETISAEFCKIYQACPEDFGTLIADYNRQGFPKGPNADDLAAALLSREDHGGRSRFDALRPVKVVSRIPDRDSMPEDLFRKELLYRIHGIVEDIGASVLRPKGGEWKKHLQLDALPLEFFQERSIFTGVLFRHFENEENKGACTAVNGIPTEGYNTQVVLDFLEGLDKVHKLVFAGNIRRDSVGMLTLLTPCADPDAAVGGKARVERPLRRYRVVLHYEVAYVAEVEATTQDEAIDLVREKAKKAPSEDFEWLQETEAEAGPTRSSTTP